VGPAVSIGGEIRRVGCCGSDPFTPERSVYFFRARQIAVFLWNIALVGFWGDLCWPVRVGKPKQTLNRFWRGKGRHLLPVLSKEGRTSPGFTGGKLRISHKELAGKLHAER